MCPNARTYKKLTRKERKGNVIEIALAYLFEVGNHVIWGWGGGHILFVFHVLFYDASSTKSTKY